MMLPNRWKKVMLADVLTAVDYGTAAKSDAIGKYPVLRMGNLENGYLVWDDLVYTSSEEEYTKYELKTGDILFNRTNSRDKVGKTSIYRGERPSIFAGYLIRLIPNTDIVLPTYIFSYTKSPYYHSFVAKAQNAVAQPNINAKQYSDLLIPVPPLALQQEFAEKVEAIEQQKALVQQSIDETQTMFDFTMDKYFG